MRKLLLLSIFATLVVPAVSLADWSKPLRAAKGRPRPSSAFTVPGARDLRSPAPQRGPAPRSVPRVAYGPWAFALGVDAVPFWLGWSWGWGYYPLWPRPYYPGEEPGHLPEDAARISARVEAYGAAASSAAAGTLALSMEGPVAGFNADVTALAVAGANGAASGDGALTLGSARATWSVVSDAAFRLRLELGGTMLSVPGSGIYATAPYANTMSFGPQLGVSGHVGLVGPFGLEGHARVTPFPVSVLDARAAVVLRGGPLAVSAGWRAIDVNGDRVDAPEAHFAGPELGLQLVF